MANFRQWMPPMINAAISELMSRMKSQLRKTSLRRPRQKYLAVLELIAKSKRARLLPISCAAPQARGYCLIRQPQIRHQVERWIGRLYFHRKQSVPRRLDVLEDPLKSTLAPVGF